jgi:hypothetical protein
MAAASAYMAHLVLLGDSIFDNGAIRAAGLRSLLR